MEKRPNDEFLLALLREEKRKGEGVGILISAYQEPLYWHIRKLVINRDDSKNVLPEVFLRVWRNIGQFKGDSKLFTWLYRIAGSGSLHFFELNRRFFNRISIPVWCDWEDFCFDGITEKNTFQFQFGAIGSRASSTYAPALI